MTSLRYLGNLSPGAHRSYLVALRAYLRTVRGLETKEMPEPELEKLLDEYLASKPDFQSVIQAIDASSILVPTAVPAHGTSLGPKTQVALIAAIVGVRVEPSQIFSSAR